MIEIRPVLRKNIAYIHWLENLQEYWYINEHPGPFSKKEIEDFFFPSKDYRVHKQQRWVIYNHMQEVGVIDVFNLNFDTRQIGIGILIPKKEDHNKGIGSRAIQLVVDQLKKDNEVQKVQALVDLNNESSLRLFEKCNFTRLPNSICMNREVAQFLYSF
jgi:diamine N-acetyltransferase